MESSSLPMRIQRVYNTVPRGEFVIKIPFSETDNVNVNLVPVFFILHGDKRVDMTTVHETIASLSQSLSINYFNQSIRQLGILVLKK